MLKVVSKYIDKDGKFVVIAQENEPNLTILPAVFDEDLSDLTEAELVDKVLDYTFKKYFAGKLANETAQHVQQLDNKLKELDEWLTKAKETMSKIEKKSELSQGSIVEMGEMVFDHAMRIEMLESVIGGNNVTTTL